MLAPSFTVDLEQFTTFGDLLKYLRRRAGLTQRELSIAVGYSVSQISRLEQNQRLPDLATLQARFISTLDLDDQPQVASRLLALAAAMRREDAPAPGLPPYKGLLYFDESDAELFFGREALVEKLVARLQPQPGSALRFLGVVGASGSGKSSLVRAGLVPALRWRPQSSGWPVAVFNPTAHPLEALAAALVSENQPSPASLRLADELASDGSALTRVLQAPAPHLLIVDQFEELFTLCRSEAEQTAFVDQLLTVAAAPGGAAIVVIALRADFYAQCARFGRLREALASQQEYIGPMTAAELRRAIEEPARRGRWELEPGLVDVLLKDVGADGNRPLEPGALPLLSHALLETWLRRRGDLLTYSGYAASGRVQGAIAETAEAVFYDQLDPDQRIIARQIFLRLTELGEQGVTADTRRRAPLSELIPGAAGPAAAVAGASAVAVREVLQALADARLITTEQDSAEVAHEALIREWPTLRAWLEEDRDGLRLHRRVTESAQEWERMAREPGALYRSLKLAQAQEWVQAAGHAEALNALEREFLAASQAAAEHETEKQEAARQRELEAARKLAETESARAEAAQKLAEAQKQRAEEQTQAAGQLSRRALYLLAALVVAVTLAGAALYFGARARQSAVAAQQAERFGRARELAADALANLQIDPERSILLALQAAGVTYALDQTVVPQAETALHWSLQASHIQLTLIGHTQAVIAAYFSPDGTRLATASQDGTVKIWDAATGQALLTIGAAQNLGAVNDLAYSPDGTAVVTADDDQTVRIWDAASGRLLLTIAGFAQYVDSVAFSPDGARVASGSGDGLVQVWDATTGARLFSQSMSGSAVVSFSPDGARLAAGADDGTVMLWNTSTSQELFRAHHTDAVNHLHFSPDGTRLATASADGTAKVWDTATGQLQLSLNLSGEGNDAAFSPDGKRLATSDFGGKVVIWNAADGRELLSLSGHVDAVYTVSFSPDGTRLATSGRDNTARIWDITPSHELFTLSAQSGQALAVAFSPDGRRLATGGQDGTAGLWDAASGGALLTLAGHTDYVTQIVFSPDGRRLATASRDSTAKLWDAQTGQLLLTLSGHKGPLTAVAFNPAGTLLATASADQSAMIWDAATGQPRLTLVGHTQPVSAVAFSPDGKRLATASLDKTAIVWDVVTGQPLLTLSDNTGMNPGPILGLAFSPDGTRLATADLNGTARIWDVTPGLSASKVLLTLAGHTGKVDAIAFSPDGTRVATASQDNTTKLWDAATGQELLTLTGHTGGVLSLAFSPDGSRLATAGGDGMVRVYALRIDDLMALAKKRVTRVLTTAECMQFLHSAVCPAE